MNCKEFRSLVEDFLAEQLVDETLSAFLTHECSCLKCSEVYHWAERLWENIDASFPDDDGYSSCLDLEVIKSYVDGFWKGYGKEWIEDHFELCEWGCREYAEKLQEEMSRRGKSKRKLS